MDSAGRKGVADRGKINLHKPDEVKHWVKALDVSVAELQQAIDKVGNSAAAVRKQLGLLDDAH